MTTFFIIGIVLYIVFFFFNANKVVLDYERKFTCEVAQVYQSCEKLSEKSISGEKKMRSLESEALEIFTLYEMTKDIAMGFNEKDAFGIFQTTLRSHTSFQECLLLDPSDEKAKEWRKNRNNFVFTLKSKRRTIGYIVVVDIHESEVEKVRILGHQFALALRRIKLYQEIEKMAITDSLTNVFTRRYCMERFREELHRSKQRKISLSFMMLDVDHFKSFNDQYGHLTGDQILQEIGSIIKENIREIDIAGRFGGEEFCVVLPDTDCDGAIYAAERIRKAVEETVIKAYDAQVKATVSIGVATFPDQAKSDDELIDKADWALYRAKKQGRNCTCSFGIYDS